MRSATIIRTTTLAYLRTPFVPSKVGSIAAFGVYEPHFDFGESERYKKNIKKVRARQKEMVSAKAATIFPGTITLDGSISKGRAMMNRQTRLTLRAFNGESASAIANTRWNNVVAMEKRILNAEKQINNANRSIQLTINEGYVALAEAHATSERARSMAQMTKSGYVYVISNIGSFGDVVVKIGLTRRVNPDDRVRELGDASVPFRFDTHAMIYSEDAPALETALHQEFSDRRVNAANMRKEFFRVSLEEVEDAVRRLAPGADFFRDREAQEWHETLARREQALEDMQLAVERFPLEI